MFATPRNKPVMTAMIFAGAFVATTFFGAGLVLAQPAKPGAPAAKFVKLGYKNDSKVVIQVDIVDKILNKTVPNSHQITPGGTDTSQAMVDKDGYIDVVFSIVGKNDKNISEYHCKSVKTKADGVPSTTPLEFEKISKC